jgi:hypothetical protein
VSHAQQIKNHCGTANCFSRTFFNYLRVLSEAKEMTSKLEQDQKGPETPSIYCSVTNLTLQNSKGASKKTNY